MTHKRARVSFSVVAPEYGRTCAVGDVVDLAERLPRGGTLAAIVRPEWFEDIVTADAPVMTRRRASAKPVPGDPAEE